MKGPGLFGLSTALSLLGQGALAQLGTYTDPDTGIVFSTQSIADAQTTGGLLWGWALPPDAATVNATEYIGLIVGSRPDGAGWSGISHGGGMPSSLLLMAWADESNVLTSFRFATGYTDPDIYAGNATLTPLLTQTNDTNFKLIYRCQGCWSWNHEGTTGSRGTSEGTLVIGWAQASTSPEDPSDQDSTIVQHDNGQGLFGVPVASAVNSQYSEWASMTAAPTTTNTATATQTGSPTTTTSTGPSVTGTPVPTDTFDYIVVGGGAGGLPMADRLSEAGKSVLLIERGPPSTYRWGGRLGPDWIGDAELTRFDIPGLCNQLWHDSAGIACSDYDQMAGCVLGGGTAVNAGLWWKPPAIDWDYNWPSGWQSGDMADATQKVFSRIPGTYIPSTDGKLYLQQGFDVLSGALADAGWKSVKANDVPDEKSNVYTHTPYMYSGGERGGPMATYLVSASGRSNFKLWMNTSVRRVIREGDHITGVEVEAVTDEGYSGVVNVTAATGRVILSAGTFGTPKILLRSGIGQQDDLKTVSGSALDGATMIGSDDWINLPVGNNVIDHVNTDLVISHPDVVSYDFYEAYDDPIAADKTAYLDNRSGILAQAAPNIGPIMFEVVTGNDGIDRQLQWTSRVEGPEKMNQTSLMTISQYLGRGATSRGRISITSGLSMTVSTLPYLRDQADIDAVIAGVSHLHYILSKVPNLTFIDPAPNVTVEEFVNDYPVTASKRRANHWVGSTKLGDDDGRNGGTAVVDLNTKVYGTDNLFVVDAGIFPGMVSHNPSSPIMIVSEKAAERILALNS